MRGIYIKENVGDKVTGFYLFFSSGGWMVRSFTRCTLALVEETAVAVIHDPEIYYLTTGQLGSP